MIFHEFERMIRIQRKILKIFETTTSEFLFVPFFTVTKSSEVVRVQYQPSHHFILFVVFCVSRFIASRDSFCTCDHVFYSLNRATFIFFRVTSCRNTQLSQKESRKSVERNILAKYASHKLYTMAISNKFVSQKSIDTFLICTATTS